MVRELRKKPISTTGKSPFPQENRVVRGPPVFLKRRGCFRTAYAAGAALFPAKITPKFPKKIEEPLTPDFFGGNDDSSGNVNWTKKVRGCVKIRSNAKTKKKKAVFEN